MVSLGLVFESNSKLFFCRFAILPLVLLLRLFTVHSVLYYKTNHLQD